jgi:hypothetical protein
MSLSAEVHELSEVACQRDLRFRPVSFGTQVPSTFTTATAPSTSQHNQQCQPAAECLVVLKLLEKLGVVPEHGGDHAFQGLVVLNAPVQTCRMHLVDNLTVKVKSDEYLHPLR